jgi:transcriptional regulator with XRE-family HTH domain
MLHNIEAERARKGMTKCALARELGVTHKTYNGYVNGTPIPSDVLVHMAVIFNCRVDYLLGLTDTPQ